MSEAKVEEPTDDPGMISFPFRSGEVVNDEIPEHDDFPQRTEEDEEIVDVELGAGGLPDDYE
jgi:hypothetical protein